MRMLANDRKTFRHYSKLVRELLCVIINFIQGILIIFKTFFSPSFHYGLIIIIIRHCGEVFAIIFGSFCERDMLNAARLFHRRENAFVAFLSVDRQPFLDRTQERMQQFL